MRLASLCIGFALVVSSLSCGKPAHVAAPREEHHHAGEHEHHGEHESWFDKLPMHKKVELMQSEVVPQVGKLFKEHEPKEFSAFGCQTCHGPQRNKHPREVLPKLHLSGEGFAKLSERKPADVRFMAEKVVPQMAAILKEKPFDPTTHQGFGCGGCHAVD